MKRVAVIAVAMLDALTVYFLWFALFLELSYANMCVPSQAVDWCGVVG